MDILVTNNPKVKPHFENRFRVEFVEGKLPDVLLRVRNYIHVGHSLLSHPLSGSVKPNENPFKSVLVSVKKSCLDLKSLQVIEESILTANKFALREVPKQYLDDLAEVDFTLISSATANILL